MVADCAIAAHKRHVTALAFAGIGEPTVGAALVGVAMLGAALGGEQEDKGCAVRRSNAALLLAAKDLVNVAAAMIGAPLFKRDCAAGSFDLGGHVETEGAQGPGDSALKLSSLLLKRATRGQRRC